MTLFKSDNLVFKSCLSLNLQYQLCNIYNLDSIHYLRIDIVPPPQWQIQL